MRTLREKYICPECGHIEYEIVVIGADSPDIRNELQVCPDCKGDGWTSEHDPADPHIDGVCSNCPIQVQCETCEATGIVWKKDIKEKTEEIESDLPF